MAVLGVVLLGWLALTAAGLVVAAALCLSGHAEDVARGFVDEEPFPPYPDELPAGSISPKSPSDGPA